jgi:hypothetical protein
LSKLNTKQANKSKGKEKKKNRKHVAGSIGYILCWSETINIINAQNDDILTID